MVVLSPPTEEKNRKNSNNQTNYTNVQTNCFKALTQTISELQKKNNSRQAQITILRKFTEMNKNLLASGFGVMG